MWTRPSRRKLGFPRPILHGLATWGIAGRAILAACCESDPARLHGLRARLVGASAAGGPHFAWSAGETGRVAAFRMRAVERDAVVLTNGEGRCFQV
jgi:acyl dehydratase